MLIEVRLMRYQGRRLPWKEIDHGKVFRGNLQTVCSPGSDRPVEAHLLAVNGVAKRLIPDLHEPAFLGVGTDTFQLRGVERLELEDVLLYLPVDRPEAPLGHDIQAIALLLAELRCLFTSLGQGDGRKNAKLKGCFLAAFCRFELPVFRAVRPNDKA